MLGRHAPLRFTGVLYDALQVYRPPSPKWDGHFGRIVS